MCEHDPIIKDGATDTKSCKVTICQKCLSILKVEIQGEKVKPKPPATGVTIGRMSVLKAATDIEIKRASLADTSPEISKIFTLAEELEQWVYRAV